MWPGVTCAIDDGGGAYRFDAARAATACDFFAEYLKHFEGEHAGKPFVLLEWQQELIVRPLFGWVRSDGTRRFRRVFVEIAKKNGKSGLASGMALLLAFADGEPGAQVYCAAGGEDQARIVFRPAVGMAQKSDGLIEDFRLEVLANAIEQPHTQSVLRPLSAKARTKHGLNVHAMVFDELHAQKDRELFDTLARGISARRQPVVFIITTAGHDRESICREEYERAVRVRDGVSEEPSVLPVIFEAKESDDWRDERTWHRANPSLGVTKSIEYMREECSAALQEPRKLNWFKNQELNIWTESQTAWIAPEAWAACRWDEAPQDLADLTCAAGLDLSSTTDLTAVTLAFRRADPDGRSDGEVVIDEGDEAHPLRSVNLNFHVDLLTTLFVPRDRIRERVERDGVPMDAWVRDGHVVATDGNVVDYDVVQRHLIEVRRRHRHLKSIGYDPWNATHLATACTAARLPMVEFRQGHGSLSAPSKLLEALIVSRRIRHNGNPAVAWCFANAEVKENEARDIKPVKSRRDKRIDAVLSTIMALGRLMAEPPRQESVYARRGVRMLSFGVT